MPLTSASAAAGWASGWNAVDPPVEERKAVLTCPPLWRQRQRLARGAAALLRLLARPYSSAFAAQALWISVSSFHRSNALRLIGSVRLFTAC